MHLWPDPLLAVWANVRLHRRPADPRRVDPPRATYRAAVPPQAMYRAVAEGAVAHPTVVAAVAADTTKIKPGRKKMGLRRQAMWPLSFADNAKGRQTFR